MADQRPGMYPSYGRLGRGIRWALLLSAFIWAVAFIVINLVTR